ncbi:MAG TPA: hypothetical protein VJS92_15990 [Candidatus Polarisedimenticolaceae bacterium]|nr:hypothetical protein [Candidatus Polarisedimenticolaceae bacterium]
MRTGRWFGVLTLGVLPLLAACPPPSPGAAVVAIKPPPARVEVRGESPGRDFVWIGGHWSWNRVTYSWEPGRWVLKPSRDAVWVTGHWWPSRGGWVWIEGHWS